MRTKKCSSALPRYFSGGLHAQHEILQHFVSLFETKYAGGMRVEVTRKIFNASLWTQVIIDCFSFLVAFAAAEVKCAWGEP